MVIPTTGSIVLVAFPFSDLSQTKLRPAIVLAYAQRDDWVLCQVTSNSYSDPKAITMTLAGFSSGSLRVASYARPGKLFTAHQSLLTAAVGMLKKDTLIRIIEAVIHLLRS